MATFPPAVHDVFHFDDLLTGEEKDIRQRTRAFMVSHQIAIIGFSESTVCFHSSLPHAGLCDVP
jgi:hypothetical protein